MLSGTLQTICCLIQWKTNPQDFCRICLSAAHNMPQIKKYCNDLELRRFWMSRKHAETISRSSLHTKQFQWMIHSMRILGVILPKRRFLLVSWISWFSFVSFFNRKLNHKRQNRWKWIKEDETRLIICGIIYREVGCYLLQLKLVLMRDFGFRKIFKNRYERSYFASWKGYVI